MNDIIEQIYRTYLGTPRKALIFVTLLTGFMVFYLSFVSKFLISGSSQGNVEGVRLIFLRLGVYATPFCVL